MRWNQPAPYKAAPYKAAPYKAVGSLRFCFFPGCVATMSEAREVRTIFVPARVLRTCTLNARGAEQHASKNPFICKKKALSQENNSSTPRQSLAEEGKRPVQGLRGWRTIPNCWRISSWDTITTGRFLPPRVSMQSGIASWRGPSSKDVRAS